MKKRTIGHSSDLFTVRLWCEALDQEQMEWRGQIKHVVSGETRYFRDWQTCIAHLQALLAMAISDLDG